MHVTGQRAIGVMVVQLHDRDLHFATPPVGIVQEDLYSRSPGYHTSLCSLVTKSRIDTM